ncbi:M24 family metallopeptidase [Ignicoccus hospitalis]|uniref:Peptidase M24 n=1 Tax=Ignicoccus hospitalis (strain KIN4/I / DSM 18386 / JCM 14125) TaxID=453591 RepID=A8A8N2_IGNH4|nr:M24 family metallopeptidase [Ignicoccus hospitalis]ABU81284.1 peptidase M24 [Ignicoccus hospitalis KIN4/I]HIH90412.1 M24 family metallopeptidase [Desulfurococcaceae archaeon]
MASSKRSYSRKRELFLDCTLILHPSNVRWLTGFDAGIVLMGKDEDYLIVPELEYERALEVVDWLNVVKGPRGALWKKALELCNGPFFADLSYLNFRTAITLMTELGAGDASKTVRRARMSKDEEELSRIKKALEIAERAFLETWKELEEGTTELAAAGALEAHMREFGAQEFAFPTIVAFGPNSSKPHAVPGEAQLSFGSVALFDFGAVYGGFRSDITRTYVPDKEPYASWYHAVLEAVNAALKALKPGARGKDVDAAAREVLAEYGFEKAFVHGLGHGVGADIHEPPFLSPSSEDVVSKGAVVTVEPGVYFKGQGGVRVEQLVYVDYNPIVLNSTPVMWW